MKAIADTLDISRSNQYEKKKGRKRYGTRKDDENYLPVVKEITDGRATYGYRRVTAVMNRILTRKGEERINHKRITSSSSPETHGAARSRPYRQHRHSCKQYALVLGHL